jgi:hypothetical protein
MDANTHTGNIERIYHLRNPRNTPHLFKRRHVMRIWVRRPYAASRPPP